MPQVKLSSAVPEGRGLVAEQPIRRGEPLLQVPERLLITPDTALRESSIGALLDHAALPAWSVLAALLAELKFGLPGSRDRWGPYIDALPAQNGSVLEWSADEVSSSPGPVVAWHDRPLSIYRHDSILARSQCEINEARQGKRYSLWSCSHEGMLKGTYAVQIAMLQGSSLEKAAKDITAATAVSWEELQPVLADGCAQGLVPRDLLSREAFTWSFSTLLSRLVKLPGSGGVDTLVPWADMLNHSPSVSAFFQYDAGTRSVVLQPDKAYQRGEQVRALLVNSMNPHLLASARNALHLRCGC